MLRFWKPALAFALLQGLGVGLLGLFGFFLKPLAENFEAKEAVIASGLSMVVLVPALVGALVGKLVDRAAMRPLLFWGVSIAMGSLFVLPNMQQLWQVTLVFLGFVVGIILYGPQATNTFLIRCYPQQRGRALAFGAVGVSVASIVLPPLTAALIAQVEWQYTLQILAVSLWLVLALAIGLGVPHAPVSDSTLKAVSVPDFSDPDVRSALKSRAFWCLGSGFAIVQPLMMVSSVCFVPHFMSLGLSAQVTGVLLAVGGAGGLVGKVGIAWLADRHAGQVRHLCMLLALLQVIGWSSLWWAQDLASLVFSVMLVGLSGGASLPLFPFANSQYFPASTLGRVNGVQMAFFLPLGLMAPPLAGHAFDISGSYLPAFAGVAFFNLFALMLFWALPRASARAPSLNSV